MDNDSTKMYLHKISILGSDRDLREKFIHSTQLRSSFDDSHLDSMGFIVHMLDLHLKNIRIRHQLWEISEKWYRFRSNYLSGSSGCIIIFDKGNPNSISEVEHWCDEFRRSVPNSRVPLAFVGIFTGEEEIASAAEMVFAQKINSKYFETNLKEKDLMHHILTELALAIHDKKIIQTYDILDINAELKQFFPQDTKQVSILNYWGEFTAGCCQYQCDKVPESFLDAYEKRRKFIKFPSHHIRQCLFSCPLFSMIDDRRIAKIITTQIRKD
ncbi:MAG: hypothetical protein ACFE95_00005 [Candidatus Hodarchaeota archaeon]